MKLISWNVNGLRACMQKGFLDAFHDFDADFVCIQETKLQEGQIELSIPGYLQFWNYAEKKGYSGTAIFAKHQPISSVNGIGIPELDTEGRVITLEYPEFYLVTCYTPNAQRELARIDYRMRWDEAFRNYIQSLDEKKPVILCGDLNVAHQEIDLKNPKSNRGSAGFSDQERESFTKTLSLGFTDTFRYLHPDTKDAYTWWSYMFHAREKNAGWRIDYFLVSDRIQSAIYGTPIYNHVMGSDHCPVGLEIDLLCNGSLWQESTPEKPEWLNPEPEKDYTKLKKTAKVSALGILGLCCAALTVNLLSQIPPKGSDPTASTGSTNAVIESTTQGTVSQPEAFTLHECPNGIWEYYPLSHPIMPHTNDSFTSYFTDGKNTWTVGPADAEFLREMGDADPNYYLRIELSDYGLLHHSDLSSLWIQIGSLYKGEAKSAHLYTSCKITFREYYDSNGSLAGWFLYGDIPVSLALSVTTSEISLTDSMFRARPFFTLQDQADAQISAPESLSLSTHELILRISRIPNLLNALSIASELDYPNVVYQQFLEQYDVIRALEYRSDAKSVMQQCISTGTQPVDICKVLLQQEPYLVDYQFRYDAISLEYTTNTDFIQHVFSRPEIAYLGNSQNDIYQPDVEIANLSHEYYFITLLMTRDNIQTDLLKFCTAETPQTQRNIAMFFMRSNLIKDMMYIDDCNIYLSNLSKLIATCQTPEEQAHFLITYVLPTMRVLLNLQKEFRLDLVAELVSNYPDFESYFLTTEYAPILLEYCHSSNYDQQQNAIFMLSHTTYRLGMSDSQKAEFQSFLDSCTTEQLVNIFIDACPRYYISTSDITLYETFHDTMYGTYDNLQSWLALQDRPDAISELLKRSATTLDGDYVGATAWNILNSPPFYEKLTVEEFATHFNIYCQKNNTNLLRLDTYTLVYLAFRNPELQAAFGTTEWELNVSPEEYYNSLAIKYPFLTELSTRDNATSTLKICTSGAVLCSNLVTQVWANCAANLLELPAFRVK